MLFCDNLYDISTLDIYEQEEKSEPFSLNYWKINK